MKLRIAMPFVFAASLMSCVEAATETGTVTQAACVGPLTAAGPLPSTVTYSANTVLPTSTESQVWMILPMVTKPDPDGYFSTYGLFRVDPAQLKVLNRYQVSKANRLAAATAMHGRLGTAIQGRPPTQPPWPPGDLPTLHNQLVTMAANARAALGH